MTESRLLGGCRRVVHRLVCCGLVGTFPVISAAASEVTLAWDPSTEPQVTGYNVYYGTASRAYTNMVRVGLTNAVTIPGLEPATTYYFAATSVIDPVLESAYSEEVWYSVPTRVIWPAGYAVPGRLFKFTVPPPSNHRLSFSLVAPAPAGVHVRSTTGVLTWIPSLAQASTTNLIQVQITDLDEPALTTVGSMVVTVGDQLTVCAGLTNLVIGQVASVPIYVSSSEGVTNLSCCLAWAVDRFVEPTLWLAPSGLTASLTLSGNAGLLLRVQCAPGVVLRGSTILGQLSFRAVTNQQSAFVSLPMTALGGTKPNGQTYTNYFSQAGEIAVVNVAPLLRGTAPSGSNRNLTVFGRVGSTYKLQYATNLFPIPTWNTLLSFTMTSSAQILPLNSTEPLIFYRLAP